MDWRTFVTEMLKTLAWPSVAVAGIFAFRRELKALIAQIKKGKLGSAEVEFERVQPPAGPKMSCEKVLLRHDPKNDEWVEGFELGSTVLHEIPYFSLDDIPRKAS
jgi:hypothetical protein